MYIKLIISSVFGGRCLKIIGVSLSGPGDFLALHFRSTLLTCDCVIQGLKSGLVISVVITLVWLYSGFIFGVCVLENVLPSFLHTFLSQFQYIGQLRALVL